MDTISLNNVEFLVDNKLVTFLELIKEYNQVVLVINGQDLRNFYPSLHEQANKTFEGNSIQIDILSNAEICCSQCGSSFKVYSSSNHSEVCDRCGNTTFLLVYDYIPPQDITEEDVMKLKLLWRSAADIWWEDPSHYVFQCERCGESVFKGDGYIRTNHFYCDKCCEDQTKDILPELQKEPNYFGVGMIRRARYQYDLK
jgi:hypothetical protein